MEWQTYVAVALAVSCACWVGWRLLRPFVKPETHEEASMPAADDGKLIHISPVE
jgi:hypothetical protein